MKTTVVPARELTADLVQAWIGIQQSQAAFDSPFLRPEFTQAVAAVRDDAEVAVLEDNGRPVGFFPFQRSRRSAGKPVGAMMSDCQAVLARADSGWSASDLLRDCGLSSWDYHGLVAGQRQFEPFHLQTEEAVYMDLSGGFEAYRAERRAAGSHKIKQARNRLNRLERQIGPVRYESQAASPAVLQTLLQWKSAQFRRTHITDVFAFGWTRELLQRIIEHQEEAFAGMLLALYAGDRLLAIDLGLRSQHVLHLWIGAYDPRFAEYCPGNVLMFEHAKAAATLGIRRMDLGKTAGMPYKLSFASGSSQLASGRVARPGVTRSLWRGWQQTKNWARTSRWAGPARVVGRVTRPVRDRLIFD